MPTYLTQEQIYRLIQREMPEDLYADGAESDYVTTADLSSVAKCLASTYTTMQTISLNHFPQTADEKIADWEVTCFEKIHTGAITLAERQAKILSFLRAENNVSYWTILTSIIALVPAGIVVEVRPRTYVGDPVTADLKGVNSDLVWAPGWVSGDPAPAGVTVTDDIRNNYSDLLAVRTQAYRYNVIVWGGSISTELQTIIDDTLTQIEPARCAHDLSFYAGALPAGTIEVDVYNAEYSKAAYADPTSNTGYRAPLGYYFGFDGDTFAGGFGDAFYGSGVTAPGGFFLPIL